MTKSERIAELEKEVAELRELHAAPCEIGELRIDLKLIDATGRTHHYARLFYKEELDNGAQRRIALNEMWEKIEDEAFPSSIILS